MRIKGEKTCNICKIIKSTEDFHLAKDCSFGVRNTCKSCVSINRKAHYYNNQEKNIQYSRNYYDKYPQDKEKLKNYAKTHKEQRKIYYKNRSNKDELYKISSNTRSMIKRAIKQKAVKKILKSEIILGCSFEEFKVYIESLWEPWMNWSNYGNQNGIAKEINYSWEIDHIIPIFSAKTAEEIYKLNHYTNLRPLCTYTNRYIKRAKILPNN